MVRNRVSSGLEKARRRGAGVVRGLIGLLGVALAACAPQVQVPLSPPSDFNGPALAGDHMVSFDGAKLGLQVWEPEAEPWAALVAVHGMSEYADAFYLAGPWFAERGVAVYAYDQRGFGRSPGRGVWPGAQLMARDLKTALTLVREEHPDMVVGVLGESMGAATVMASVARSDGPLADRVVLVAPGVRGWSALPIHYKLSLAIAARVAPRSEVRPPRGVSVQATDNMEALYKNGGDPLFLHDTRIDMLYGLISLMEDASKSEPGRDEPTLFLYGAKDELIPLAAAREAASRLGECARSAYYEDGWHMLLRDLQAEVVWADILAFLEDPAAPPPSGAAPVPGTQVAEAVEPRCQSANG